MKGLVKHAGLGLVWTCVLFGGLGCYRYRELIDPCWPDRYNYMARRELKAAFQPQIFNGHILDQTLWNYFFEPGTDRLTAGGLDHLAYLARRRPHPDTLLFLQTAQDLAYDPSMPDLLAETRASLDARRIVAIQKFLVAQTGGSCAFRIEVHDPAEPYLPAAAVNNSYNLMVNTRFFGGITSTGSSAPGRGFDRKWDSVTFSPLPLRERSWRKEAFSPLSPCGRGEKETIGPNIMNKLPLLPFLAGLTLSAVLALVLLAGQPLQAASTAAPREVPQLTGASASGLLLADDDDWSFRKLLGGVNNRTRVVQICIVTMCLALIILIKK